MPPIIKNITFNEVSTFLTLLGGYDKLTEGYICSSAVSTSKNYDDVKKKHVSKLLADTWSKLDKDFFDRVRKYLNKEQYNPIPFFPRPHQENATNEAYNHFITNKESRGKLIFPCGAGKSLTGFWMMEKLDSMSTVIAVPSLSLIKQTLDVYLKEIVARGIKVNWLCICSDEGIGDNSEIRFKTDDIGVPCKTDPEYIKDWLIENKDTRNVIFTTYQSSRLIASISKELNHTFDGEYLETVRKLSQEYVYTSVDDEVISDFLEFDPDGRMSFKEIEDYVDSCNININRSNLGTALKKLAPNNEPIKLKVMGSYKYRVKTTIEIIEAEPIDIDF